MTDRPILFSAPMVRALLDGRKTMTRRIITDGNVYDDISSEAAEDYEFRPGWEVYRHQDALCAAKVNRFVGDRLWVRESVECANGEAVGYPVDGTWLPNTPWEWARQKLPSIHMPRRLSRLTLVVADVRVERLQDISEAGAIAEGVERDSDGWRDYLMPHTQCCASATDSFGTLWDSITGPGAWEANPWVSVTFFDVHRQNIDQMDPA